MKRNFNMEKQAEADMTPMLDIVFILLIFFIVTTSFVKEQGFLIQVPDNKTANSPQNPAMKIDISANGDLLFNNKAVDIERVPAKIEQFLAKHDATGVIVQADNNTNYQDIVSLLDQIKRFKNLTIAISH